MKHSTNNSRKQSNNNLVWLDLEMTGLNPQTDQILEMAIVITDNKLDVIAESPEWVFTCDEKILQGMDSWNSETHSKTGLLEEVRSSSLDYATGQQQALEFLGKWVAPQQSPMCGSTICQDRRFMATNLPKLNEYFHYRNFDVTVFKLAVGYWMSALPAQAKKNNRHRAKDDILESIEEMVYYQSLLFKQ